MEWSVELSEVRSIVWSGVDCASLHSPLNRSVEWYNPLYFTVHSIGVLRGSRVECSGVENRME